MPLTDIRAPVTMWLVFSNSEVDVMRYIFIARLAVADTEPTMLRDEARALV
jgi:hypothetical protein